MSATHPWIRVGDLEIAPLLDGSFRLDGGAMFGVVPKPLWERRAPADARNRIALAMRPLLVKGARLMMIDAGIGGKMDAKSVDIYAIDRGNHLQQSLARAGVSGRDIEVVLASHLHFDHAGGFTSRDSSGRLRPAFERARYLVHRGEWDDATHPHERNRASYLAENFVPLQEAGVLEFFDDGETIMDGVRVRRTGGETAVFAADLIPTTAHVDVPWIMGYDLYPMETLAFKRAFVREAIEREYLILFEHDPEIEAGYVREKGGRIAVEPVR